MANKKLNTVFEQLNLQTFDVDQCASFLYSQRLLSKDEVERINFETNCTNKKEVFCDLLKTKPDDIILALHQARIQYNWFDDKFFSECKLKCDGIMLERNVIAQVPSSDSTPISRDSHAFIAEKFLDKLFPMFANTYQIEWIVHYLMSVGLLCPNECNSIKKEIEIMDQFQTLFRYLTCKPFEEVIKNLQQICLDINWPRILNEIVSKLEEFDRSDLVIYTRNSIFTIENIQPFTTANLNFDNWKNFIWLGSGSFGEVRLYPLECNSSKIACKRIWLKGYNNEKQISSLTRELAIHRSINNEYIVTLFGFSFDESFAYFFMEYMPGGSLKEEINSKHCLTEGETLVYAKQILCGLKYLHENGILHRDLKSRNILKFNKNRIKLSDFGESKRLLLNSLGESDHSNTGDVGTVHFMAPEVISGDPYGRKSDIWSFGCVIVEMLTGQPPWGQYNGSTVKHLIGSGKTPTYKLESGVSIATRRFLDDVFDFISEHRPDAKEALELPIFREQVIQVADKFCFVSKPDIDTEIELVSASEYENTHYSFVNSIEMLENIKGKYLKKYFEQTLTLQFDNCEINFGSDGSVKIKGPMFQLSECSAYISNLLSSIVCTEYIKNNFNLDNFISLYFVDIGNIIGKTKTLIAIADKLIIYKLSSDPSRAECCLEIAVNKNLKVCVYKTAITEVNANAIVISANSNLSFSDEIGTLVVDKGGKQIQAECEKYISINGLLNTSDVYVSSSENLYSEKIIHFVGPKYVDGFSGEKIALNNTIHNVLRCADSLQISSIAITLSGELCYPAEKAVSIFVKNVIFLSEKLEYLKEIYFVDNNEKIVEMFIKELVKFENKMLTNKVCISSSNTENNLLGTKVVYDIKYQFPPIVLLKDDIINVASRCDVIVNSVSNQRHFMLRGGNICNAIIEAGGLEIVSDAEKHYPYGFDGCIIAVTTAGKLNCKTIFHVNCLDEWDPNDSMAVLEANVAACLDKAEEEKLSSIAFPALGTGGLSYPPYIVANVMYNSVYSWVEKHKERTLKEIFFVILPSEEDVIAAFVQEERVRNEASAEISRQADNNTMDVNMVTPTPLYSSQNAAKFYLCGMEHSVQEASAMLDKLPEQK